MPLPRRSYRSLCGLFIKGRALVSPCLSSNAQVVRLGSSEVMFFPPNNFCDERVLSKVVQRAVPA